MRMVLVQLCSLSHHGNKYLKKERKDLEKEEKGMRKVKISITLLKRHLFLSY